VQHVLRLRMQDGPSSSHPAAPKPE